MTVRVGVIGLGFMGSVHLRALQKAAADGVSVRIVAVWDPLADRREQVTGVKGNITQTDDAPLFDRATVAVESDLSAFLSRSDLDLVSICSPTDSHIELIEKAVAAGKAVVVEKPVALDAAKVEAVAKLAAAAGVTVMPAMCIRFWPGWRWLKDAIGSERYGSLLSLRLSRTGAPPAWSSDFYGDPNRCGDAICDLHIHDVDFIRWALGMPVAVSSVGTTRHLSTRYFYQSGPTFVEAEGGWLSATSTPFRMSFRACFEGAVVRFDSDNDPPLTLFTNDGVAHPDLPPGDGYDGELRHMIDCLQSETEPEATLAEAAEVMHIIDAERRSLESGQKIEF